MKSIILTIGIPTFNRLEKLKLCLEYIYKQNLSNEVEVLISDNGSTDGTEIYMKKIIKSFYFNLHYVRNNKNLGFDRNIINIYKKAKGQYIWFFSDDDIMLPNIIENIIKILNKYSPAVVLPNQIDDKQQISLKDNFFLDIVRYMPTGIGTRIRTNTKFRIINEVERLAITRALSFISCCIVKRDSSFVNKVNKFIGTGIMQDAFVSLCLLKNPTAYISNVPSVIGSGKEYFSSWFMTSTLYGVRQLYSNKLLEYPKNLWQKLALNNCKFALIILAQEKILSIPIYYQLTSKELKKIIKVYRWGIISLLPFILLIYTSKLIPKVILSNIFKFSYFLARKLLKH